MTMPSQPPHDFGCICIDELFVEVDFIDFGFRTPRCLRRRIGL
jgi:hypothetical protein